MNKAEYERIISDYKVAYESANKRPMPHDITYERGWFALRGIKRVRAKELMMWTSELKSRATIPAALGEKG